MWIWLILVGDWLWVLTFIFWLRIAVADRIHPIPIVALCLNFGWEFVFTFYYLPSLGEGIDYRFFTVRAVWFVLDAGLLALVVRYAPGRLRMPRRRFVAFVGFGIVAAAALFIGYGHLTPTDRTGSLPGIAINLIMSILFVRLLAHRPRLDGISLGAAWSKMLATGTIGVGYTALALEYQPAAATVLPSGMFVAILFFDLVYVLRIHRRRTALTAAR